MNEIAIRQEGPLEDRILEDVRRPILVLDDVVREQRWGCTPQACAYRDRDSELRALDATVFGLSTQSSEYQREMAARLHLPFEVLSDVGLALTQALRLPTFRYGEWTLLKRHTLVVERGRIVQVFYPVFPPDADAGIVSEWLRERMVRNRG